MDHNFDALVAWIETYLVKLIDAINHVMDWLGGLGGEDDKTEE